MRTEIKAPTFPESIADGSIATWHKQVGDAIKRDELIVDIETDKVVIEVVAPDAGVLTEVVKQQGETVLSDEIIGYFQVGAVTPSTSGKGETTSPEQTNLSVHTGIPEQGGSPAQTGSSAENIDKTVAISPSVRQMLTEHGLQSDQIKGSGKGGRIVRDDIIKFVAPPKPANTNGEQSAIGLTEPDALEQGDRFSRREPMSRLRAKIADRLVEAQQNMAMLTTFNEINMQPIMSLRSKYKVEFEKRHEVKLGFMSFFVKAAVEALKKFPSVNASIDGRDIIYHGYQDIGVAVSSPRGLVVPVLRNVENLGLAAIESAIRGYGEKAREGKLAIEDMLGGTFTISNGGVFGSLLSTPIVNPPQTAILGMHKIQERPMAIDGQVVILPMMYLAMSYDHRLIDGKEAVGFLVSIKQLLEEPERLLLEL